MVRSCGLAQQWGLGVPPVDVYGSTLGSAVRSALAAMTLSLGRRVQTEYDVTEVTTSGSVVAMWSCEASKNVQERG